MKLANARLKPETVSLDGQRIDKDYEIRFAVKGNWSLGLSLPILVRVYKFESAMADPDKR